MSRVVLKAKLRNAERAAEDNGHALVQALDAFAALSKERNAEALAKRIAIERVEAWKAAAEAQETALDKMIHATYIDPLDTPRELNEARRAAWIAVHVSRKVLAAARDTMTHGEE